MSANESPKSRQSREKGQIRGRAVEGSLPRSLSPNLYSKRMQVYAYTCATVVLVGLLGVVLLLLLLLLIGVGWLYKIEKVSQSDSVLMFILGQVLGAWVALTNKIFRITAPMIGNADNV